MCYGLKMGNRFLLVKDEVTDVLYICSIICLIILVRGKLGYGEWKLHEVLPFHFYALELIPTGDCCKIS